MVARYVARYVAYWNAASHTTGSSINMISHWSSDLVRNVSATSNRKWLKYIGVNFFSPNIKSGSTIFYHFLPAEKDVENELISKWTQKISCHYTNLIMKGSFMGYLVYHHCEVLPKNFSLLQKKKKFTKTLYLLPITLHYSFSRPLAIMNLLSVSGVAYSTHFI